jgi:hypothetical protein
MASLFHVVVELVLMPKPKDPFSPASETILERASVFQMKTA